MRIEFTSIDGRYLANAQVEIPKEILNHFLVTVTDEVAYVDIPHIKSGSFTRIMGDVALKFTEESEKLMIPAQEYKGIYIGFPINTPADVDAVLSILAKEGHTFYDSKKALIERLGFQDRGPALLWHPALGDDNEVNRITFDINTDDIPYLILKVFNAGYRQGAQTIKTAVWRALHKA
jgi:hypothetical protein